MALMDKSAYGAMRQHPRFKLDVDVNIHSKTAGLVVGRSAEISEAGMSVMLVPELTVGEVVELDFELPFGPANVLAIVRSRNAFRYGFKFVQPHAAESRIKQSCGILPPSG
jgi:PilZ domain-containing protein